MTKHITVLGVAALAGLASAQPSNPTFIIEASNDVSPAMPTTTITVSATWDEQEEHVFSGADYDLVATGGEFTSANLILIFTGNTPGTPSGARVNGASIGQIHNGSVPGRSGNPIELASYEWTTTNFSPRTIDFSTENTTQFGVTNRFRYGPVIHIFGTFTPGSGSLVVIPAPPAAALLGIGALIAARRRR
jgi:hypothetical protein